MSEAGLDNLKPLQWVASSLDDLRDMPEDVRREFGFALYQAQIGLRHRKAKPLRGFGGAGVLEVIEDHRGDTYRAVYTIKFAGAVFVLNAFQKKSKEGAKTPKHDLVRIKSRLQQAEQEFLSWSNERETESE